MAQPFDSAKNEENIRKHGLPLSFGAKVLADPYALEALDDRMDYGEVRWNVLGMVGGVVYALTYTDRTEGVRYISVRAADRRESDRYFQMRG
ncbi:BrnT family toxin [Azospirillum sp.]|uniref:BrnT family toxin n=1 Tax=Azospirillum sp. TaxID=34012 RepID=UPI002D4B3FB7|nr:BrnT family toxin [Azospirillum sp.]HYD70062.1 BrnT family toxin [Azospirillum sp.]